MLAEEKAENTRYFYELASARFGWRPELVAQVQAFHFKGGQGAKTGTGGHLPGAAPLIFRNHISVPTIPALARARKHLDARTGNEVTLIITGGLRVAEDFVKALALGADAVAVSNSAMQAVGCIAARMCNSNNCPVGVATQKPELRARLDVQVGAERLARYFGATIELMQVLSRACGHENLSDLTTYDITTWKREMADLSGIEFAGLSG